MRYQCIRTSIFLLLPALFLLGQDNSQTQSPPAAAPAAAAAPVWSAGPIDFSGAIDGYYSWNDNHTPSGVGNQLYNFDIPTNQFNLNLMKLTVNHDPDPVGFRVDFGYGQAMNQITHAGEGQPELFQYLEQAFVEFKPKQAKGLEMDFGKFVTSAGAEVIESYSNWNYSRSLLFAWAIPYYHFGLRTSFPVGSHFSGGVQVVNGWNDVTDNNTGKTIGLTGALTFKKWTWNGNYYTGPEKPNTNTGFRNLYDTTLLLTPSDKVSGYINYDYGRDKNIGPGAMIWDGVAFALHIAPTSKISFTPRWEIFDDRNGFAIGTPYGQKVKEVTITGEYKLPEGLLWRLEYRHDYSDHDYFYRGSTPNASKTQDTLTLAMVAFFGPKR